MKVRERERIIVSRTITHRFKKVSENEESSKKPFPPEITETFFFSLLLCIATAFREYFQNFVNAVTVSKAIISRETENDDDITVVSSHVFLSGPSCDYEP